MPRYVILLHEMPPDHSLGQRRDTHWDLMLESDGVLQTWAVSEEPRAGAPCSAEKLADHRLAYLDYEGPVSGNRGSVTRWDTGTYEVRSESPGVLEIELRGRRGLGRAELRQSDDHHCWMVSFSAEPTSG